MAVKKVTAHYLCALQFDLWRTLRLCNQDSVVNKERSRQTIKSKSKTHHKMETMPDIAWVTKKLRLDNQGHRFKPSASILNKNVAIKWLLGTFCYTQISVLCPDISKKLPLAADEKKSQDPQPDVM